MGLFDKVTDALEGDSSPKKKQTDETAESGGEFVVPEWVVEDKVNVEKRRAIIHEHYEVTETQSGTIARKLKDEIESTDRYSHTSIRSDLEQELDIADELLETIILTEIASIELIDTVNTYLKRNNPDDLYKLSAPDDNRTHPVTHEAAETIESKGGVTMEELAQILIETAEKYEHKGGTPERMDHWVPHEKFRFSIVRHVDF